MTNQIFYQDRSQVLLNYIKTGDSNNDSNYVEIAVQITVDLSVTYKYYYYHSSTLRTVSQCPILVRRSLFATTHHSLGTVTAPGISFDQGQNSLSQTESARKPKYTLCC